MSTAGIFIKPTYLQIPGYR